MLNEKRAAKTGRDDLRVGFGEDDFLARQLDPGDVRGKPVGRGSAPAV